MKFFSVLLAGLSVVSFAAAQDLSKLKPCALNCVINTVVAKKCTGPADTKCICTEDFTNTASTCFAKCKTEEIIPALDLQRSICPDLGLPNLGNLSPCAQTCVLTTLPKVHCAGPLDKKCICGIPFGLRSATCLLGCGLGDIIPSLGLEIGICKPPGPIDKCTATGVWRLLQPACWFKPPQRRATPVARAVRAGLA